jgi:hypothetical protein
MTCDDVKTNAFKILDPNFTWRNFCPLERTETEGGMTLNEVFMILLKYRQSLEAKNDSNQNEVQKILNGEVYHIPIGFSKFVFEAKDKLEAIRGKHLSNDAKSDANEITGKQEKENTQT